MKSGPRGSNQIFSEMNLIPLIDVSLILVIIFMVLTPVLIQSQITVKLPEAKSGTPPPAESTIQVQIGRQGAVRIDDEPVKLSRFERELAARLSGRSNQSILVQADQKVPIQDVVFVLDAAKRLGVRKLGIGVLAPPQPER